MPEMFDLLFSSGLLDAVGLLLGDELTLSPIQHLRPYIRAREGRQPWMLHEWQCALTDMPPSPLPAPAPLWLTPSLVVRQPGHEHDDDDAGGLRYGGDHVLDPSG